MCEWPQSTQPGHSHCRAVLLCWVPCVADSLRIFQRNTVHVGTSAKFWSALSPRDRHFTLTASGVTHVSDHRKSRATSEGLCFRTALYVKQFFWSFANKLPEVILWIDAGNLRNKRDLNLCFEKSNYKVEKKKGPFHNMVKNKILNFTHYP